MDSDSALKHLKSIADPKRAQSAQKFFKTGPGEYGEGDQFLGISNPQLRQQVKLFKDMKLKEIATLLTNPWHEVRFFALLLMVNQFKRKALNCQQQVFDMYVSHTDYINNWDLVDCSAYFIFSPFLVDKDRQIMYDFIGSNSMWERRIAMVSTYHFIKNNDFKEAIAFAEILLDEKEDLMHKAAGWMLREVGNRDKSAEDAFLNLHYQNMPRTMLRYAIEKYPEDQRQSYLKGTVLTEV